MHDNYPVIDCELLGRVAHLVDVRAEFGHIPLVVGTNYPGDDYMSIAYQQIGEISDYQWQALPLHRKSCVCCK